MISDQSLEAVDQSMGTTLITACIAVCGGIKSF